MLKLFKRSCEHLFTLTFSTTAGFVSGLMYLFADGLKCAKDIHAGIVVDAAQLNLTAIEEAIFEHKGNFTIPFEVELYSKPLQACSPPVIYGMVAGAALGLTYIAITTAYRDQKQKQKQLLPLYKSIENTTTEKYCGCF